MADFRISDKAKEASTGSLARRVLLISFCLLVLPLGVYFLIDLQNNYRERLRDLFLSLDALGRGQERLVEEFLELERRNLATYPLFLDFTNPKNDLTPALQEIAERQKLSSLFYLDASSSCLFSSDRRMVGLKTPFFDGFQDKQGAFAFLGESPVSQKKEIYITEPTSNGILVAAYDAQGFLTKVSALEWIPYAFHLSLIAEDGSLFLSSDPAFSMGEIQLLMPSDVEEMNKAFFQFAKAEEKSSLLNLFKEPEGKIGLKLPVGGSRFSLLIDLPKKESFQASSGELLSRFALLVLLILVIGGGAAWWLMRRMARPLKTLSLCMHHAKQGDLTARYRKDPLGFEVNFLGSQFNAMVEGLAHHIAEVKRVKVGKELLLRELKIGHEIQQSIFPKELPHIAGIDIAAGFHPANQVTGDFYDLFFDSDKNLIFTIGDAAGKGIPACLYALLLRSMLRTAFSTMQAPLDEIIESANRLFCLDTGDSGYFATAWIGKLDMKNQKLHFSSCGHHPVLIVRKNGEIEELATEGMSIGVDPEMEIYVSSVSFEPGDLLLLFSDGVLEAHDKKQQLFGKERLQKLLEDAARMSAEQLTQHIFKEVEAFSAGAPQHDDLMLLVLRMP